MNTKMAVRQPNATCEVCGQSYWVQSTRLAQSRFCSNACKSDHASGTLSKAELTMLYYDQRLSMQQIAVRLGCSVNKVVYRMQQCGLERRDISEATYAHWNPDGDPFHIRMPETKEETELFALALGLYMGEGGKTQGRLLFANNHVGMHQIFLVFLERICGVPRTQVRAVINIFDDCDPNEVTLWWCQQLALQENQFFKPNVRVGKGTEYTKKSEHGTLSISFGNTKLKQIVDNWCNDYYNRYGIII